MRVTGLFLALILLFFCQAASRAVDLMLPVATTDPAYTQLRQLNRWGILTEGQEKLSDEKSQRVLTRYDIAFLLIEPLKRCTALVDVQESVNALPEQRSRAETACFTFSNLSTSEMNAVIVTLSQLRVAFGNDIDQLSPNLNKRAGEALLKLSSPTFRPWNKTHEANGPFTVHMFVNPHVQPDSVNDPWLLLPSASNGRASLSMRGTSGAGDAGIPLISTRSVSSLKFAADLAISRMKLYAAISTLPGEDPTDAILKPDGSGVYMFGVQIGLMHYKDVDFSTIFMVHFTRTGDPANRENGTAAAGGIGLSW